MRLVGEGAVVERQRDDHRHQAEHDGVDLRDVQARRRRASGRPSCCRSSRRRARRARGSRRRAPSRCGGRGVVRTSAQHSPRHPIDGLRFGSSSVRLAAAAAALPASRRRCRGCGARPAPRCRRARRARRTRRRQSAGCRAARRTRTSRCRAGPCPSCRGGRLARVRNHLRRAGLARHVVAGDPRGAAGPARLVDDHPQAVADRLQASRARSRRFACGAGGGTASTRRHRRPP